jgi:hypothetical protein
MPFTFSHPAIVLPFTCLPRQWFSLTGLVIGSLAPDFEYFLRMRVKSDYSHTVSGLFYFDLPLGLFLAFIFHNIVRNALFENLPTILKSRLILFKQFDWNKYFRAKWFVVAISILIGAATHLFWDSFTHEQGYFTTVIPSLGETIEISGKYIPIFKILQHTSTLIGGLIIIASLFHLQTDKYVSGQFNLKYWGIFAAFTLAIIGLRLLSGLNYKIYGHLIVTGVSAVLIALTLTPLLIQQKK